MNIEGKTTAAQTPAEGIMLRHSHDWWKYYNIPCTCGCESHVDFSVGIEESTDNFLTCHVYSEVKSNYWSEPFPLTYNEAMLVQGAKQLANAIISRAKICWLVITRGYVKMESHTMLSKQQALNMSTIIATSISDMEAEYAKRQLKASKSEI